MTALVISFHFEGAYFRSWTHLAVCNKLLSSNISKDLSIDTSKETLLGKIHANFAVYSLLFED